MELITLTINGILCSYSVFLLFLIVIISKKRKIKKNDNNEEVSIIVPFRNEAHNLGDLLLSLGSQDYKGKYELILVNDGSTDNFNIVIEHLTETLTYSIKVIESHFDKKLKLTGKQQALDKGVEEASYKWLAFTDADVKLKKNWISSLMNAAENKRTIAFGHTAIGGKKLNLIEKYSAFQLEYLFSAAYSFNLAGIHGSCMGNNMAISKDLYNEIGGQKALGYTITEDMKLINHALSIGAIVESVSPFSPTVITKAPSTISELVHQAIRWARGGVKSSLPVLIITILSSVQSVLFIALPLLFLFQRGINTALISIINFLLLTLFISVYIRKTKSPAKLYFFPLFYILYAIQSITLAFPMLFLKPKWKEREL